MRVLTRNNGLNSCAFLALHGATQCIQRVCFTVGEVCCSASVMRHAPL